MLRLTNHDASSHVLYNRLRVDIGVLCDFMDDLCGSMLISLYLKSKGTLDGLTLPKGWLARLLQDAGKLGGMKTERWEKYIACMGRLLGDVYTGNNAGQHVHCSHSMKLADAFVVAIRAPTI